MNAEQKVKYLVLAVAARWNDQEISSSLTGEEVDDLYDDLVSGEKQDAKNEVRESGIETGLSCESSRHYESEAVAAQCPNGEWVGWTYWHGGGKHGEPESIDWMGSAYDIDCKEEEKLTIVRSLKLKEGA